MKIIVFGATGGTGRQILKQALAQGDEVTAFARTPEKLEIKHERLTAVQGDALNYGSVEDAIRGHDAVVCALGMPNIRDGSQLRARATKNIVAAMEKLNVKRLVCLSSLGAGDSFAVLPLHYKYLIAPIVMRNLFIDHNLQEKYIMESQLVWTIARPGNLTDEGLTGQYQHGDLAKKKLEMKISRADTAEFMLKQLNEDDYLYKAAGLSY